MFAVCKTSHVGFLPHLQSFCPNDFKVNNECVIPVRVCVCKLSTRVHLIAVDVRATVAAADAGEGGNRVSVAVTVAVKKQ